MNCYEESRRFFSVLYPSVDNITFQTFGNSPNSSICPEILYGKLEQHWEHLQRVNAQGAGIYSMVNVGDGVWRANDNVKAITSVLLDLDGSPIEPVLKSSVKPHAILQTSPDRFQARWRISPIPVNDSNRTASCELFRRIQRGVAERFGGDRSVSGLSGVARIPGFLNMKHDPFPVRIYELNDIPEYSLKTFIDYFRT